MQSLSLAQIQIYGNPYDYCHSPKIAEYVYCQWSSDTCGVLVRQLSSKSYLPWEENFSTTLSQGISAYGCFCAQPLHFASPNSAPSLPAHPQTWNVCADLESHSSGVYPCVMVPGTQAALTLRNEPLGLFSFSKSALSSKNYYCREKVGMTEAYMSGSVRSHHLHSTPCTQPATTAPLRLRPENNGRPVCSRSGRLHLHQGL